MAYLIGQRVIVGDEIAVIISRENVGTCLEQYDVKFTSGLVQYRRPDGVKPLPNGQL